MNKLNWKLQFIRYKEFILTASHIVKSIAEYSLTKSKFSLLNGIVAAVGESVGTNKYSPYSIYSAANDWMPVFDHDFDTIFLDTLNRLPCTDLHFNDPVKHYTLNGLEFVSIIPTYEISSCDVLAPKEQLQRVRDFLVQKKLQELDSKILYVEWIGSEDKGTKRLALFAAKPTIIPSRTTDHLIAEIQRAFDLGMNRSYLFYGVAGAGKTTIANSLVSHFNLRTLRFRGGSGFSPSLMLELIDLFKIEAIIFDDFDQEEINAKLFGFLEVVYSKVKLMIGVANSLEEFAPAVLRPARMDELVKISELDQETVRELLGDLYDDYGEKAQHFPVAYLNELKKQAQLNPEKLEEKFKELDSRVKKMLATIGGRKTTSKTKKTK